MKILFDPIYTSFSINKCASAAKFKKLALHILAKYPDAFITWPIHEDKYEPSDLLFLPKDERIRYVHMKYSRDRYREYKHLFHQQESLVASYGEFWDWDLMVTNRTPLVPLYKQIASHHSSLSTRWSRRILVLEDFPQMGFKTTAAVCSEPFQDAQVILGMFCADRTAISSYWEKAAIIEEAKKYFAPVVIKRLHESISEATPVCVSETELKSAEFIADKVKPFTLGFAGRLSAGHQFDKIFDVMEKNWVYRHDWKVKCLISTQSRNAGVGIMNKGGIPSFIELHYANRELFHSLMRTRVHVGVYFTKEEGYSMSLMEPLIMGVPYAVIRAPWSEPSLGPEYPFFFRTQLEAFSIIKAFHDDYAGEYAKFAEWSKKYFEPLLRERNKVSIFTEFDKEVAAWRDGLAAMGNEKYPTSTLHKLVIDEMKDARIPMDIGEALRRAESKGKVRHIADKFDELHEDTVSTFSSDWNLVRLRLMAFDGAIDCSPLTGVMRLP